MITNDDIIKDGNEILRLVSKPVTLPLTKKDLSTGKKMLKYLEYSQDEKKSKKYNLTAGVGLAAPQIAISKRFFAVLCADDNENLVEFVVYNPEIIAESVQMEYLSSGEGCLSIPGKGGLVLRHKKIKVKGTFYNPLNGEIKEEYRTFTGYPAIVFQHEFDHLNGILFTDRITTNVGDAEQI